MQRLVTSAFKVTVAVEAPPGFPLTAVLEGLPPDYHTERPTTAAAHVIRITTDGPGFAVDPDYQPPHGPLTPELAVRVAQSGLELTVAEQAPDLFFIHAGAVVVDGRAIVLPGPTTAGKSTLTLALVEAGARYLSDEFAVVDTSGLVHPYARPVAMRHGGRRHVEVGADQRQRDPAPVGMVADLTFDPARGWRVASLTPGESALCLLGQSASASTRPEATLDALLAACARATGIRGTRDEAAHAAARLMQWMLPGDEAASVAVPVR